MAGINFTDEREYLPKLKFRTMNKENLKKLLENPELKEFLKEYKLASQKITVQEFIALKENEISEPVYKTEDGYEVKGNDGVYFVLLKSKYISFGKYDLYSNDKQFKLKENAENFLIENAEVLSYNEFETFFREHGFHETKLKQKIRQKLVL